MRSPLISICIPTYNGREHLAACVASVRAQTLQDFEVVLCDDASGDDTAELARKLAAGDPRFRIIRNPVRLGLVGNWNHCLAQARGEWVKFVFQDDLIRPTCCERLLDACRQTDRRFAFCERDFLFDGTVSEERRLWFCDHRRRLTERYRGLTRIDPGHIASQLLTDPYHNPVGEPPVTLIHRSLVAELGVFDDVLIQICDAEYWNRILLHHGAASVAERLAVFRVHGGSTTALNHRSRSYRTRVLDPLVMLHRRAFGPDYRAYRASAELGCSVLALRRGCALVAYAAWKRSREGPAEGGAQTGSLRAEWKAVAGRLPGLVALAWVGGALAACYQIRRRAMKR